MTELCFCCLSAVTSGKYSKPNNISYEVVRNSCTSDVLLCAKLKFFNSVAKQMSPFLTLYQIDKPMALFVNGDLYKLLKALMKRFVKPAVMKDTTSDAKLASVEISSLKSESLLDYSKTDTGFEAETAEKQAIQEKKVRRSRANTRTKTKTPEWRKYMSEDTHDQHTTAKEADNGSYNSSTEILCSNKQSISAFERSQ